MEFLVGGVDEGGLSEQMGEGASKESVHGTLHNSHGWRCREFRLPPAALDTLLSQVHLIAKDEVGVVRGALLQAELNVETVAVPIEGPDGHGVLAQGKDLRESAMGR